jgi:hypothetical protein
MQGGEGTQGGMQMYLDVGTEFLRKTASDRPVYLSNSYTLLAA